MGINRRIKRAKANQIAREQMIIKNIASGFTSLHRDPWVKKLREELCGGCTHDDAEDGRISAHCLICMSYFVRSGWPKLYKPKEAPAFMENFEKEYCSKCSRNNTKGYSCLACIGHRIPPEFVFTPKSVGD